MNRRERLERKLEKREEWAEVAAQVAQLRQRVRDLSETGRSWRRRRLVVELALRTGLRVCDLARLRVGDVPTDLAALLADWIEGRAPEEPLLTGHGGAPASRRTWQRSWETAVRAAGLPDTYTGIHTARRWRRISEKGLRRGRSSSA